MAGVPKRVLVTGASGCIGSQVLPLLVALGAEVHAVARRPREVVPEGVTWHEADLLAPGVAERLVGEVRAEGLLHLAWYVAPGQWATALENLDWVQASLALVRAFHAAGGRRVTVAGSGLEYDWRHGYCSETRTPCVPHTLYGHSKHALGLLVRAFGERVGLSVAWPRVFFVYGPGEHPSRLVPAVVTALLDGERARCSHGMQVRDYLYSGDVADALVAVLASDVEGPVNVASGQAITLRALAERAGELLDGRDRIDFGAIPAAATDLPLVVADVARLHQEVGWRPKWSLDAGLRATIEWWRGRRDG